MYLFFVFFVNKNRKPTSFAPCRRKVSSSSPKSHVCSLSLFLLPIALALNFQFFPLFSVSSSFLQSITFIIIYYELSCENVTCCFFNLRLKTEVLIYDYFDYFDYTMWSVRAFASSMTSIHFDLVSSFSKVFHALLTTGNNDTIYYYSIHAYNVIKWKWNIKNFSTHYSYLLSKACCALSASSWFLSGCTRIDIWIKRTENLSSLYYIFYR